MIKIFEMFSGYGGASFALKKAGIKYKNIGFSEIDQTAIKCFNTNFPNVKNFGDCSKINPKELEDFDLLTAGFPCQPFSEAGKHKGINDTRGSTSGEQKIGAQGARSPSMVFRGLGKVIEPWAWAWSAREERRRGRKAAMGRYTQGYYSKGTSQAQWLQQRPRPRRLLR